VSAIAGKKLIAGVNDTGEGFDCFAGINDVGNVIGFAREKILR
jgi:hypothetical protein